MKVGERCQISCRFASPLGRLFGTIVASSIHRMPVIPQKGDPSNSSLASLKADRRSAPPC
jgi:hypothetical protein